MRTENFAFIGVHGDGTAYLIEEVTLEDNYLIEWYDDTPIGIDFRRIELGDNVSVSGMLRSLLERRQILELQRAK